MLFLAENGLLHDGSFVVLHDFRRARYVNFLDAMLEHYDLVSAVTNGYARGVGIFEYRASKSGGRHDRSTTD